MTPLLMVFARAPVAGECKTRLVPALGSEGAAALQRHLSRRALEVAAQWRERTPRALVELWCAPDHGHPFFAECARDFRVTLRDQPAGDLGARMWLALMEARRAGRLPVLIGTDCPWIDAAAIAGLHTALATSDCAFIAAEDGGYVAVGMARAVPELFAGVAWGTAQVMAQTRERARRAGASLAGTGRLPDVDVPGDLARLRADFPAAGWLPG
jgi:rSAM/selenodomain-associated transferase 1